ncbi:MAG: TIGR04282 family arsenosugar biosynthesis glycosyltransferase [Polaribacter sp.]|uniref:TIGR04282 family arsenosugar biosynthesis glycosyltransferase n=1 Tax=Polaribacter sp. TaxID=1920175 RepID=UPI003EF2020A
MIDLKHSKTAILIFSLSQEAENLRKPFLQKKDTVSKLNALIKEKVSSLGVDYFHYTEKDQKGNNFGERYVNTVSDLFKKGYDNVITVGNDTLSLEKKHLRTALNAVGNKEVPIGPSYDGGFYLLGLRKDQFNAADFLSLSWESSTLYKELKTLLSEKEIATVTLPCLYDLDEELDISKNIASLSFLKIEALKLLQNLQVVILKVSKYILQKFKEASLNHLYNKGPPLVCN